MWKVLVFGTWKHCRKAYRSLFSGQMIPNYTIYCWPTTSSDILIVDHKYDTGGLKVIDCIVLSAEYWCLNPFRTKTPKYLFPRGNEPVLYHQIGNRNVFIFITNQ